MSKDTTLNLSACATCVVVIAGDETDAEAAELALETIAQYGAEGYMIVQGDLWGAMSTSQCEFCLTVEPGERFEVTGMAVVDA